MNENTTRALDTLDLEVFRHAVKSIVEELEINLTRTAYSVLITEFQDYCIAILNEDFELISQSDGSIPIFISNIGDAVRDSVDVIGGPTALAPGDVMVSNYAKVTGQHINNTTCATPIYDSNGIAGYLAIRSHWADLGGLAPGGQSSASRSIFHEGTQYRGLRVMRGGEVAGEVLATIEANTWQPETLIGDLMSQLAACKLVARRWEERIASRWSAIEMRELVARQFAASRAYARDQVAALPDGEYSADYSLVYSAAEDLTMKIPVKVTIDGDSMVVDLTGMPPQVELPINSGADGGALSAVRVAFKSLVGPEWPVDAAFFDPLTLIVPDGTLVSATDNAPMGHWNMPMSCIIDLVVRAIGLQHAELVPASHYMSHGGGVRLRGVHADGSHWWALWPGAGGLGASIDADGYGPVKPLYLGDNKTPPVEMLEARFPIICRSHRLLHEAGGEGLHRGGPGLEVVVEITAPAVVDSVAGLPAQPAQGLAGGGPGQMGQLRTRPPGTTEWSPVTANAGPQDLEAGTWVHSTTGGGGGWGRARAAAGAPARGDQA